MHSNKCLQWRYSPVLPALTPRRPRCHHTCPPQLPRRQHSAWGDSACHPADAGDAVPRVDDVPTSTRAHANRPLPAARCPLTTTAMPKPRAGRRANAKGGKVLKTSPLQLDPDDPADNAFQLVRPRFSVIAIFHLRYARTDTSCLSQPRKGRRAQYPGRARAADNRESG